LDGGSKQQEEAAWSGKKRQNIENGEDLGERDRLVMNLRGKI